MEAEAVDASVVETGLAVEEEALLVELGEVADITFWDNFVCFWCAGNLTDWMTLWAEETFRSLTLAVELEIPMLLNDP